MRYEKNINPMEYYLEKRRAGVLKKGLTEDKKTEFIFIKIRRTIRDT